MSFLARSSFRAVTRATPRVRTRTFASENSAALQHFEAEAKALQHHAAETSDLWRKISYYVCLPGIAVCVAWVYNAEAEHAAHLEHLRHENGGELPEIPGFDYMNRRAKPFPWGANSLFYNPHTNKDMN
ncbi:cytochrome c oxidase, subunit VIa [Crucibulum laeve]|uniref:Cytochrome c oxidase, subunit VIa n=1 Tax=Crucibulum laeve TaxID=68775 RepID=A0A5C3MBR4_9AGAR|nr:cytochrome c oxidase, subunit VIa [Crucibulum laeve]